MPSLLTSLIFNRINRAHRRCSTRSLATGAVLVVLLNGCTTVPSGDPSARGGRADEASAGTPALSSDEYRSLIEELKPTFDDGPGLTEYALYRMLIGEFAGQRGHLRLAAENYYELAEAIGDPVMARRATKIAVFARENEHALNAAELWSELAPYDKEARRILASLLIGADRADEAMGHLEYVLSGDDAGQQITLVATALGRHNDTERSHRVVEQLLDLRPDDPNFLFAHAIFALRAGKTDVSEQAMEKIAEINGVEPSRVVAYVSLLQKQGKLTRAVRWMEYAVEAHPEESDLRMLYARLLGEAKRYEEARTQFEVLAEDDPDDTEVLYALGLLHVQSGRIEDAKYRFGQLIERRSRTDESHFYLAQIAESESRLDDAIEHYQRIVDSPRGFHARSRIAFIYSDKGAVDEALTALDGAVAENDEQTNFLIRARGEILTEHRRFDEAMALYDEVLADRFDSELLYTRAMLAEQMGRLDRLEQDLNTILEQEPDNAQALNALGYTLADRTDRLDEAHEYISRALELRPEDFYILDSMGWVLYRMGRLQEAVEYLERARDLRNDPEIAAHLGEVLWVLGERDAARDVWDSALKDTPGDRKVLDVIERLSK